jgi:hypothetical protein
VSVGFFCLFVFVWDVLSRTEKLIGPVYLIQGAVLDDTIHDDHVSVFVCVVARGLAGEFRILSPVVSPCPTRIECSSCTLTCSLSSRWPLVVGSI